MTAVAKMALEKPARSKLTTRSKPSPSHPPFHDMITDAIASMKERNGSSHAAIRKFVEQKHGDHLPPNFRKSLIAQLKRLVALGKLVKVKKSFKVPGGARPSPRSSARAKGHRRSARNSKGGNAAAGGRTARSAKISK